VGVQREIFGNQHLFQSKPVLNPVHEFPALPHSDSDEVHSRREPRPNHAAAIPRISPTLPSNHSSLVLLDQIKMPGNETPAVSSGREQQGTIETRSEGRQHAVGSRYSGNLSGEQAFGTGWPHFESPAAGISNAVNVFPAAVDLWPSLPEVEDREDTACSALTDAQWRQKLEFEQRGLMWNA
jgi:hypothetical protein